MRVSLGDLVDRLGIVNQKIWALENVVRKLKSLSLTSPAIRNKILLEIGRRAILIRDLNKERVAYRNSINEISEEFFGDLKIDHMSAYATNQLNGMSEDICEKLQSENLSLLKVKLKKPLKKEQ